MSSSRREEATCPPALNCRLPTSCAGLGEGFPGIEPLVPLGPLRTFGKIKFIITDLLIKKTPSPGGLTCKFYETFKEEIVQILHKLFQERQEEQSFPSSFL